MRAVVQRVSSAHVKVGDRLVGAIGPGLVVFLGVGREDGAEDCSYLADKVANLRIFEDEQGLMNLSLKQTRGEVLCISQFTLYGDCRKGRRPSFSEAASPETAKELYIYFCDQLCSRGLAVATGQFQAAMEVMVENAGPVTILLDSNRKRSPR